MSVLVERLLQKKGLLRLSPWEDDFLESIEEQMSENENFELSGKQFVIVNKIYNKNLTVVESF